MSSNFSGNTTQKQVYLWWSTDGITMVPVSAANPLPVTGGGGGGAVTIANGADVALGSTTDAKSTATDGTAATGISLLKEISFMEQNPASRAVTNAGTFLVQAAQSGTWTVGLTAGQSLAANQSVNVSQINAVTPLMGNGVTGTGSQRTTNASDNSAIANWGHGATGASVPTGAQYHGTRGTTALPSAVTDGQTVGVQSDKFGRQAVVLNAVRDLVSDQTTSLSNTTAEITIVTLGSTGIFNDLTNITAANTGASATEVTFRDATAGSVRYTLFVPAGDTRGIIFPSTMKQTTSANNWTAQCATATTAMKISVGFVQNK